MNGQTIPTLLGPPLTVTVDEAGNIFVNEAQIVEPDIQAANGVIHIINGALIPERPR
jgi:uncharacterized surface protein with fasciclin (FAS1) repeats